MDDYAGPEYASIQNTCDTFGVRPSKLYELLGQRLITAKKLGKRILVSQRSAKQYFDGLPAAEITPSRRARERATKHLQDRFLQELAAAATRLQARAILTLPRYRELLDSLPSDEHEKLLARAQDIISEKRDD